MFLYRVLDHTRTLHRERYDDDDDCFHIQLVSASPADSRRSQLILHE